MDFWAAAFSIKNLPTPNFADPNLPLIQVKFIDGVGQQLGRILAYTNFTYCPELAGVLDSGVAFDQVVDPSSGQ